MSLPYWDCTPGVTNSISKVGSPASPGMPTIGFSPGCAARSSLTAGTRSAIARACRALIAKPVAA